MKFFWQFSSLPLIFYHVQGHTPDLNYQTVDQPNSSGDFLLEFLSHVYILL